MCDFIMDRSCFHILVDSVLGSSVCWAVFWVRCIRKHCGGVASLCGRACNRQEVRSSLFTFNASPLRPSNVQIILYYHQHPVRACSALCATFLRTTRVLWMAGIQKSVHKNIYLLLWENKFVVYGYWRTRYWSAQSIFHFTVCICLFPWFHEI